MGPLLLFLGQIAKIHRTSHFPKGLWGTFTLTVRCCSSDQGTWWHWISSHLLQWKIRKTWIKSLSNSSDKVQYAPLECTKTKTKQNFNKKNPLGQLKQVIQEKVERWSEGGCVPNPESYGAIYQDLPCLVYNLARIFKELFDPMSYIFIIGESTCMS